MPTYEGGFDPNGDLVQWQMDIETFDQDLRMINGEVRTIRTRQPEATLTLYSVNREESIAVIGLLNQMRANGTKDDDGLVGQPSTEEARTPSIGDRFGGLEFD